MLFVAITMLEPPAGMPAMAWLLVALLAWMVAWWLSEALPLAATALLPVVVMPLAGIAELAAVTQSYGHPLIFLFLGGFMLARAIEASGLHRRMALVIVSRVGTRPPDLTLGFMIATAFLSMWITNTAATIMMYAVALSVIDFMQRRVGETQTAAVRPFAVGLMLAVAYSASIGGMATLIGSPVNGLLATTLAGEYGIEIDFLDWLLIGLPVTLTMLVAAWLLLARGLYRIPSLGHVDLAGAIRDEAAGLGALRPAEKVVGAVFVFAAIGWILGGQISAATGLPVSDTTVAIAAALLLFAIPLNRQMTAFALDWNTAKGLPWNVLILIGGGLAIATGFRTTGLAGWIDDSLAGLAIAALAMVVLVAVIMVLLTEIMSNPASAATILPVVAAVAVGLDLNPLLLAVPAALAANMSFMLPVATAPNAIVFSNPNVKILDMMRAGFCLNLIGAVISVSIVYFVFRPLYGW